MREAGRERQRCHLLAVRGDPSVCVERAKLREQLARLRKCARWWRIHPRQRRGIVYAGVREVERERGEIGVKDLRSRARHECVVCRRVPETIADAGRDSTGATATLVGRCATDTNRVESRQSGARIEARQA